MSEVTLPASYDLRFYRGDDLFRGFVYAEVDDAGASTIDTADGWTARSQIRSSKGGEVWLTLDDQNGLTLSLDGLQRLAVALHVTGDETASSAWDGRSSGVWDLEIRDPNGVRTTIFAGRVDVTDDVTREA